jgi:hypothetical protein
MKYLIFSALIGITPQKDKQKEPISFKSAFIIDKRGSKIVKTILNRRGNIVDMNYKGLVYIIYEDFTIEKTILG